MMHSLTNGGWGFVIRRFLEAGAYLLPLMALLFVPVFFGLGFLYPWTDPNVAAHNEAIRCKHLYLNVPMLLDKRRAQGEPCSNSLVRVQPNYQGPLLQMRPEQDLHQMQQRRANPQVYGQNLRPWECARSSNV